MVVPRPVEVEAGFGVEAPAGVEVAVVVVRDVVRIFAEIGVENGELSVGVFGKP
jgi:hypothetical protein